MSDNIGVVWSKFFNHRTRVLWERFPGYYRALVVETNDPLNIYRIRVKCPDMHDFDLKPEDCPWAVPSHDLGGFRAGRFSHPCIGDWVWITFERQHPYAPIWVGFANPTRRKLYTYPQVFQKTPLSVNEDGKPADSPNDYDVEYLPKDGRPMAHGWQDRYGSLDIHSSVGYFPKEHDKYPPPRDHDAIQQQAFNQQSRKPEINNPDKKYSARVTKYGNMIMLGDQGYYWKRDGNFGEFTGSFKDDEKFETKRWKYLQRLLNEGVPNSNMPGGDQRRILTLTRYGHRIECRDVGWAQVGPQPSKSRDGELGPASILSKESDRDERWIKIRTKGGMLFQSSDIGFDPAKDAFIKRQLIEEQGAKSELENVHWKRKDARWMRMVTRHGFKIVLDDRGSDTANASKNENPRGNGILIKGRRSPAAGDRIAKGNQRGFFWEFNENDKANHTMWGTPLGNVVEMNDRYQYTMIASTMGSGWSSKWMGIKENEFVRKPTMIANPEMRSHHLKLDHENEYLRLKTRANSGPSPENSVNPSGVNPSELNQGIEARDGINGDGPWVEVVDCQHRGMWWSKKYQIGVWRAKRKRKMYMWMDEINKDIAIYNNEEAGKIIIYANREVQVISNNNINIRADGHIFMKAGRSIRMQAGGTKFTITKNILTNAAIHATRINAFLPGAMPGLGAGRQDPQGVDVDRVEAPKRPEVIEPTDRAKTYNQPYEVCPKDEVEHPLK